MTPPHDDPARAATLRPTLDCPCCGQAHRRPRLAAGQRARCTRCGSLLEQRGFGGGDAALAFTLAGIVLAIPALRLPMVAVDKLGNERLGFVATGAQAFWDDGMPLLSTWVLLCGVLAPVVLLGTLAALLIPARFGQSVIGENALRRAARALEQWAMPEVHILAVLVALTKLGVLVNVHVGAGLWFYAAMSVMILLAWRSFEFGPRERRSPSHTP